MMVAPTVTIPKAQYLRMRRRARARVRHMAGSMALPAGVLDRLIFEGNCVRILRQFRGWTQARLAAAVGVSQSYVADIESGRREGPFDLHGRIAKVLGVPFNLWTFHRPW